MGRIELGSGGDDEVDPRTVPRGGGKMYFSAEMMSIPPSSGRGGGYILASSTMRRMSLRWWGECDERCPCCFPRRCRGRPSDGSAARRIELLGRGGEDDDVRKRPYRGGYTSVASATMRIIH
jgi:hypothetical protein